ncbi:transcriptional regulator [Streptomyces ficellus]|uniref:Transcriptional regulator n=1 Tax=Streptomyces ficellus TaxID=1977088 RepID=A0ABT7Z0Y1_9ACTN|nr:transcriptional regulator [Streptomyces ficellus]MDN3293148.1 transcriptional regulator [Streptomyces ficellus]
MLLRLAEERATGALLRDHGTLYLVEGRIVHAESPVAPGPDVLLTAGGRLARGRIAAGELEICLLGALFDAAFFALAPGGPARFRYGVAPWTGTVRPVSATDVERETLRRRLLLDSVWPYPAVDTAPVVPRPASPGQTVTARQRALLAQADGVRTPAQLAWALGRPAFHTLLDVRRLAAAGLVATPHEPTPYEPAPNETASDPDRDPDRDPAPERAQDQDPDPDPAPARDPDIALLRRLRDALEAHL